MLRRVIQKKYFHLPLEYDCCAECNEKFPHRVRYSEQSFSEELADNYKVFLSNNYKDIEGETGVIKLFKINENLFILTEEALWKLPANYQEKTTSEFTTYIGTGDFFAIPPRKILDSKTGQSAGTQHKWSVVKTPHGVFYISENQNTVYQFNGESITPISDYSLSRWFKKQYKNISRPII